MFVSWYHAAIFILWHWWQYGSMQCLHCGDFTSNPARPFLFGLVGCSHPGSLQGKSQNWRPCPSRVQNQQARSKVKSLWQLHSSYMKALGAFNSQLLSSGTNTANGVNRVSRPQTSEATCGGFKEWADCSGSILRKLKRCSLPILRYLPWSSLLRGPKRRWKIL